MKKAIGLILASLLLLTAAFADAKGDDIAKKHFALTKTADTSATATMTLIDSSSTHKTRKLEMYTKQGAEGKNSFVNFLEPGDVAGTKFLTIAHTVGGSEQRLYLPALKKARKIASSAKDGEFVNSDLFYYDMEDRTFDDCTYTFLSENETINDKAFTGMTFYKVEMRPKDSAAPYGRMIAWINMTNFEIYKVECYDRKDNSLLKSILFVKVETIQGCFIPTQTAVSNLRKGSTTLLQLDNLKVNTGLKDNLFTVKNLEQ